MGTKCQLTRSSLDTSNTALPFCSGVSAARKLLAASGNITAGRLGADGACAQIENNRGIVRQTKSKRFHGVRTIEPGAEGK
jgi:hypothetical protein